MKVNKLPSKQSEMTFGKYLKKCIRNITSLVDICKRSCLFTNTYCKLNNAKSATSSTIHSGKEANTFPELELIGNFNVVLPIVVLKFDDEDEDILFDSIDPAPLFASPMSKSSGLNSLSLRSSSVFSARDLNRYSVTDE